MALYKFFYIVLYCTRLLQRRPRRSPDGNTGTTAESPARGGETRARPETTRPCNSRPSFGSCIGFLSCNELSTNCVTSCTRPWLVRRRTTSPSCSRRSPTFHHALHCGPPATATSSNQERSGELVTVHSLSPHLVHGITYRQNWNSCSRRQQHSGAIWSLLFRTTFWLCNAPSGWL